MHTRHVKIYPTPSDPPQAGPTKWVALHPSCKPSHTDPLAPPVRLRRRPRKLWTACGSIGVPKRPLLGVRGDMARRALVHGRVVSQVLLLRRSNARLFRCPPPRVCSARILPTQGGTVVVSGFKQDCTINVLGLGLRLTVASTHCAT